MEPSAGLEPRLHLMSGSAEAGGPNTHRTCVRLTSVRGPAAEVLSARVLESLVYPCGRHQAGTEPQRAVAPAAPAQCRMVLESLVYRCARHVRMRASELACMLGCGVAPRCSRTDVSRRCGPGNLCACGRSFSTHLRLDVGGAAVKGLERQPRAQRVAAVRAEEERHAAHAQVALAVALAVQRVKLRVCTEQRRGQERQRCDIMPPNLSF